MGQNFLKLYWKYVLFSDLSTNSHPLIYNTNLLARNKIMQRLWKSLNTLKINDCTLQ